MADLTQSLLPTQAGAPLLLVRTWFYARVSVGAARHVNWGLAGTTHCEHLPQVAFRHHGLTNPGVAATTNLPELEPPPSMRSSRHLAPTNIRTIICWMILARVFDPRNPRGYRNPLEGLLCRGHQYRCCGGRVAGYDGWPGSRAARRVAGSVRAEQQRWRHRPHPRRRCDTAPHKLKHDLSPALQRDRRRAPSTERPRLTTGCRSAIVIA